MIVAILYSQRKTKMRNSIIAIFLAALAGDAMAAWTVIESSAALSVYVDRDSVRPSGNIVKMWTLTDYAQPKPLGHALKYSSSVSFEEFDCLEQRSRTLQTLAYQGQMTKGPVVFTAPDTPWAWSYVVPGSVGELTLKVACASK